MNPILKFKFWCKRRGVGPVEVMFLTVATTMFFGTVALTICVLMGV